MISSGHNVNETLDVIRTIVRRYLTLISTVLSEST